MVITISCPECHTSFPVDPGKIPERGVKVRCSACAHVFRVERPGAEEPDGGEVAGGTGAFGDAGAGLAAAVAAAGAATLVGGAEEMVGDGEAAVVEPHSEAPSTEAPSAEAWSFDDPHVEEPEVEESGVEESVTDLEDSGTGDLTISIDMERSESWGADPDPYSLDGIEVAGADDGSVLAGPDEMPDWAVPGEDEGEGTGESVAPVGGDDVDEREADGGSPDAVSDAEAVWGAFEPQESGAEPSVEATILEEAEPAAAEPDVPVVEPDVPVVEPEPTSVEPDWAVDQQPAEVEPEGTEEAFEWPVVEPEPTAVEPEWPAVEAAEPVLEPTPEAPAPEPAAPAVQAFSFGKRDPMDKARRLARVLVSDMIMYNAERHQVALQRGTLAEDFEEEIDKSWKEFVDQVGPDIADGEGRGFWIQALNDILAKGKPIF